jgi:hypothetical protein
LCISRYGFCPVLHTQLKHHSRHSEHC